ncbi:MAG: hypothetical protein A2Z25_21815 [Planctomycetes bacterium RBG_16_55_9]|nr:MAG: hypothetical protein A2Z25_21815 [Planctomycetes bacterium RBG_16_55_9]
MKPKSFSVAPVRGRSEISYNFQPIRRQRNEKGSVVIRCRICILLDGYGVGYSDFNTSRLVFASCG